jgi:hypothetical protein
MRSRRSQIGIFVAKGHFKIQRGITKAHEPGDYSKRMEGMSRDTT